MEPPPPNVRPESSPAPGAAPEQYLSQSDPVSSLLPPLPVTLPVAMPGLQTASSPHNTMSQVLQTQLAAALLNASRPASLSAPAQAPASFPRTATNPLATQVNTASASALPANVHDWSIEQLEQHVSLLQQLKQPVPQNILLLLADAKRKHQRKNAKRIANRRSACTSRARKKAFIKEMTELNARLKRQALILALLPDLLIVINVDGGITFCSAQVERVLQHKVESLVGAKLWDLLEENSREKLKKLIGRLTNPRNAAEAKRKEDQKNEGSNGSGSNNESGQSSGAVALVSDKSFPVSVVQVGPDSATLDENDTSDASGINGNPKEPDSLTRSLNASSMENSGSDNSGKGAETKNDASTSAQKVLPSSDTSNSSSLSANATKLLTANANLERNVRWHNKKMKEKAVAAQLKAGYKDDVIGADVTANNASARLSSLQHRPESPLANENSDDSGYRESNDSRIETSSSGSGDSSLPNGRRKPLAPTCTVSLIRKDLTTISCEVTSSIRTRNLKEESEDPTTEDAKKEKSQPNANKSSTSPTEVETTSPIEEVKEIILCLRPIRGGGQKVDEKYRYIPEQNSKQCVSTDCNSSSSGTKSSPNKPLKKRTASELKDSNGSKRNRKTSNDDTTRADPDTEAVESLMMMSTNSSK